MIVFIESHQLKQVNEELNLAVWVGMCLVNKVATELMVEVVIRERSLLVVAAH